MNDKYNIQSNKIKMVVKIAIFYLFLMISTSSSIANDYIWINYQKANAVRQTPEGSYNINIPCEAKINSCIIRYTQLPDGWVIASDNSLNIPRSDVNKVGGFVLKAIITSIFGDRIDVDLVITFQNNYYTVSDRNQFLSRNGYNKRQTFRNPLNVEMQFITFKNQKLQGFPSISQVKEMINNKGVYEVLKYVNELVVKAGPCQQKVTYLNEIYTILQNKIAQNNAIIKSSQLEVERMVRNIRNLERKRNQQNIKRFSDKQYNQTRIKLRQLNQLRQTHCFNQTRNQFLANNYYNYLKNETKKPKQNKTKQQLQIQSLERQLQTLTESIQAMLLKKTKLEQQIQIKKSQMAEKNVQPIQLELVENDGQKNMSQTQLMQLYQTKYREYSQQALQIKLKIIEIDKQIQNLTNRLDLKSRSIKSIQEELQIEKKKMSQRLKSESLRSNLQLKNVNQVYIIGADNFRNKIIILNSSFCM